MLCTASLGELCTSTTGRESNNFSYKQKGNFPFFLMCMLELLKNRCSAAGEVNVEIETLQSTGDKVPQFSQVRKVI